MGIGNWIKSFGNNTLYFSGCYARSILKEEVENYKKILDKLNIAYISFGEEELSSGIEAYEAGYKKEAKILAEKNYELFKKNTIIKIIVSSAASYYMFKKIYPKLLKEFDIEIEHISVTILEALRRKRINFEKRAESSEHFFYQDPCYLGRKGRIYEEPREILVRLGAKIEEFSKNKEKAYCIGACGNLMENFVDISKKMAKKRVEELKEGSKIIIPYGKGYFLLKETIGEEKVEEYSSYILNKLKEFKI